MAASLPQISETLQTLAPLHLAADWDNVGLLLALEPERRVRRAMLTIDLTGPVLEEAVAARCELIVSYHSPIFRPLQTLRADSRDAQQRVVAGAARHRIAIYSPHTALDAADGGVNDWLADGLGRGHGRSVIEPQADEGAIELRAAAGSEAAGLAPWFEEHGGRVTELDDGGLAVTLAADVEAGLRAQLALLDDDPEEVRYWRTTGGPAPAMGQGRMVLLQPTLSLDAVVRRIKQHLGLGKVRVAAAARHAAGEKIHSVGLCAGAGGSVIGDCGADLLWTGEMRHHDVLAAVARGSSVVLCEHTNTERGYLPVLRGRLSDLLPRVDWVVSELDADPLQLR